ncbi:MAG: SRPBCC family protein [Nocardioides sp.]
MTSGTITITRTVAASLERVYAAWTEPQQLAAWWWPQLAGTTYDLDVRVGGTYRIHAPTADLTASGRYTEVDPPRRLAFTWSWADQDTSAGDVFEDQVLVTFEPTDDGHTRVTVAHTSTEHVPGGGAEQGWNDTMDRLVAMW